MKQIDFREMSDAFWERVSPLLEPFKRKRSGGSRPLPQIKIRIFLKEYGKKIGFNTEWQAMDGSLLQTPTRSKKICGGRTRNPTDRGRSGSKLHLHVDGQGIPLGLVVVGGNVHDSRLVSQALENSQKIGGHFLGKEKHHLCLDKGYDYKRVYVEVAANGFEEHIHGRQTERRAIAEGERPRCWVVERTFGWLKGFRLRTRYCHFVQNYIGMVYLAFACILWRKLN